MGDFFGWRPTLSGSLAIANCVAWMMFIVFVPHLPVDDKVIQVLVFWTQVFLGFPMAWLAILGHTYGIFWTGFFIGLNSFV